MDLYNDQLPRFTDHSTSVLLLQLYITDVNYVLKLMVGKVTPLMCVCKFSLFPKSLQMVSVHCSSNRLPAYKVYQTAHQFN